MATIIVDELVTKLSYDPPRKDLRRAQRVASRETFAFFIAGFGLGWVACALLLM